MWLKNKNIRGLFICAAVTILVSPVQILNQTLVESGQQLAQQLLVFPIETQVVAHGKGLQGEASERLHQLIAVEMQTEVVSSLYLSGHDPSVLQLYMDGDTSSVWFSE